MSTSYDYYSSVQDYLAQQGHEGAGLEREAVRVSRELEKVFAKAEVAVTAAAPPDNLQTTTTTK